MSAEVTDSTLDFALRYAAAGFPVLPLHNAPSGRCTCRKPQCDSPGKHPRLVNGAHGASTDPLVIADWFKQWPDANLGMTLAGLVVVDEDPRNGGDVDALPHKLPETCNARTGGGGSHRLYRALNGARYPGQLAPGIDVKSGAGSYVVVEPSIHASGNAYVWLGESEPWTTKPAEAPDCLAEKKIIRAAHPGAAIAEGGRNSMLASMAGVMRRKGMSATAITAALLAENAAKCAPPLPDDEVRTIAHSMSRYAPAGAAPDTATLPGARFPRVWLDDAQVDPANDYIIKGVISGKTLTVVFGPSGDGKTFFTADLIGHIAAGQLWRGKRVSQMLAGYVAAEAGTSILRRFYAWREHHLSEAREGRTPLAIITRGANLLNAEDVEALLLELRAISVEAGRPLGIVVFDTLSRSMPGGDENAAMDMSRVIAATDRIRDELNAASVIIHHTGKDTAKGPRGSNALFAAADTVISVIDRVATLDKVRDGRPGEQFAFDLKVVELGHDEDGDPITTCIVMPTEATTRPRQQKPLSGVASVALDALHEALGEHGQSMPGTSTIPEHVKAVTLEQWRARFLLRYGSDGDGERGSSAVRKAFVRGREALMKAGSITISDPYVWPSRPRSKAILSFEAM